MIVLDSSLLVARYNARDTHHAAATQAIEGVIAGAWGPALLPEYVLLEVATVLAARSGLTTAVAACQALLDARELEFVPCSEHFLAGLELFRAQPAATLSFVDATLVAIARARGATHVGTFDADFHGVAGLTMVPA